MKDFFAGFGTVTMYVLALFGPVALTLWALNHWSPIEAETSPAAAVAPTGIQRGEIYDVKVSRLGVKDLEDRAELLKYVEHDMESALGMILAQRAGAVNAGEVVRVVDLSRGLTTGLWAQVRVIKSRGQAEAWGSTDKRGLLWIQAFALE